MSIDNSLAVLAISLIASLDNFSVTANPFSIMLRRYLIENVEHSGKRRVDDVERNCLKVGQNIDKMHLLLCISSSSPEIIVMSFGIFIESLQSHNYFKNRVYSP